MPLKEKVRDLVKPVLASLGLELFELTFQKTGHRSFLRIFIDKEGGITLDDCQRASREISLLLDVKDVVPESYNLEVSSPGINRPIRNVQDYNRYKDYKVKVKLFTPIANQKVFIGINRGLDEEALRLEIKADKEIRIPLSEIEKANLEVDF
jgi:ribosome maturation factor RimP